MLLLLLLHLLVTGSLVHVGAVTILPTSKGAREIEILRHKMEEKIEEVEAGYDCLIELTPDDERKYLEKKAAITDEAIQAHARILPALSKCPT